MNKLDDFWRAELANNKEVIEYIEFLENHMDKLEDIGSSDDYHGLWDIIESYNERRRKR